MDNIEELLQRVRATCVTYGVMLLMLGFTFAGFHLSQNWSQIHNDALLYLGGNVPLATLDGFGHWRLLAAKFQIGSWRSLAFFLPFFWVVATAFERRYGSVALAVAFVLGSLVTSAATLYLMNNAGRISIGAGGPALALMTCMLVTSALDGRLKEELGHWRSIAAIPYLLVTVDAMSRGTADLYSLGSGAVFGLVIAATLYRPGGRPAAAVRLIGLAVAGCAVAAILVMLTPKPPFYLSEVQAFRAATTRFFEDAGNLNSRFAALNESAKKGEISGQQLGAKVEQDLVPAWRELEGWWRQQPLNPAVPEGQNIAHVTTYVSEQRQFVEASARAWKTGDAQAVEQAVAHLTKAEAARAAMVKR